MGKSFFLLERCQCLFYCINTLYPPAKPRKAKTVVTNYLATQRYTVKTFILHSSNFLKSFSLYENRIFFNVYSCLREQSMSGEGAETEGDTESEAGSRLPAVSTEPNAGLELT